jgi:transcription initiation factor IIE alpha subunit
MPWCEECAKYWTPNSMNEDGSCPKCGRLVEEPDSRAMDEKAPWHFKLLVASLVLYLGWRFIEIFT